MGGFGSGNRWQLHRPSKRRTVEETLILSIDNLRKSAAWQHGRGVTTWTYGNSSKSSVSWRVVDDEEIILDYTVNKTPVVERISLDKRPQKLGGVRYFFACPACGKRTLKLYGVRRFLCRTCQDLTYESCQESGGAMQRMFSQEGFVQIFQNIFDGVKITPKTAQKLMEEQLRGEREGTTWRKLRKKMRHIRKGFLD